jgi:hypothetical protein
MSDSVAIPYDDFVLKDEQNRDRDTGERQRDFVLEVNIMLETRIYIWFTSVSFLSGALIDQPSAVSRP